MMQDKFTFEYAIIRFVPKVEREEFFNVGVLLFSKQKKFLGIKFHVNSEKMKAFSCDFELEELMKYLHAWELICAGKEQSGPIGKMEMSDRFRWLAACRSSIIQSSKTHPGICENPENELVKIFEKHVL